jgi:hypothetical protein
MDVSETNEGARLKCLGISGFVIWLEIGIFSKWGKYLMYTTEMSLMSIKSYMRLHIILNKRIKQSAIKFISKHVIGKLHIYRTGPILLGPRSVTWIEVFWVGNNASIKLLDQKSTANERLSGYSLAYSVYSESH